ncbi:MAG: GIY-YIG nuclease family protein [Bacteroidota bacterium]
MSSFTTYILFSNSKNKFYVGSTSDLQRRLSEHNSRQTKSTKFGVPWELIYFKESDTKSNAARLESKIKKRGNEAPRSKLRGIRIMLIVLCELCYTLFLDLVL